MEAPEDIFANFTRCLNVFCRIDMNFLQRMFPVAFSNIKEASMYTMALILNRLKHKSETAISRMSTFNPNDAYQLSLMADIINASIYLNIFRVDESLDMDQPSSLSFFHLDMYLGHLVSRLSLLVDNAPSRKRFENPQNASDESKRALDDFERIGSVIRSQPHFGQSNFMKLEQILSDFPNFLSNNFAEIIQGTRINVDNSFIALMAPSMEGKTQSAFVLRRVKPLYFPLSGFKAVVAPQPIYGNFAHLGDAINHYSALDLITIRGIKPKIDVPCYTDFDDVLLTTPLWTVGFICKLIETSTIEAERNSVPDERWMRFHAERPGFEFYAKSIRSIPPAYFTNYVLFLDEFVANSEGIFIQNLARVANLRCLVSTTNTKITNLTMALPSGGGDESKLWSLVVNNLVTSDFYDDVFNLRNFSSRLIETNNIIDQRILHLFSAISIENLAKHTRPGILYFTKLALDDFIQSGPTGPVSILNFLDYLVLYLNNKLLGRKPSMSTEMVAKWANISLLFSSSYEFFGVSDLHDLRKHMHLPSFLEQHIYYLINPKDPQKWAFLTFPPSGSDLTLCPRRQTVWSVQSTYFDCNDILTILACLSIPFYNSITAILKGATVATRTSPGAVSDLPNPNAFKLPGNVLEISAVASIAVSTHHFFELSNQRIVNTFSGQNGVNFLKNLVVNLIERMDFEKGKSPVSFQFPTETFDLENDFLEHCHLPYLYGIDRRITQLDNISDSRSSVYFGNIERTSDESQIDSKFEMRFGGRRTTVAAECKNRKKALDSGMLEKIIRKATNLHHSKLCLVFCKSFSNEIKRKSAFISTCQEFSINAYRVKLDLRANNTRNFTIAPIGRNFPIIANPQSICIIFESTKINSF